MFYYKITVMFRQSVVMHKATNKMKEHTLKLLRHSQNIAAEKTTDF